MEPALSSPSPLEASKPQGLASIAVLFAAVVVCWTSSSFPSDEWRAGVSAVACVAASAYTFHYKLEVAPTSVFVMTALCSLLNACAVGSFFTYKFFVSITAPVSLIQTLLLLPVKFEG